MARQRPRLRAPGAVATAMSTTGMIADFGSTNTGTTVRWCMAHASGGLVSMLALGDKQSDKYFLEDLYLLQGVAHEVA